jgi:hypothetical protein
VLRPYPGMTERAAPMARAGDLLAAARLPRTAAASHGPLRSLRSFAQ